MSRRPAKVTQADVARAIRAARQCGAWAVRIQPDGTIKIELEPEAAGEKTKETVEPAREIVL